MNNLKSHTILTLIFKAQRGLAMKYLVDVIFRYHSASFNRPLHSLFRLDLLVPHSRTAVAQSRSFASIGPTLWNALSPSVRSTLLAGSLSSSFASLKTFFLSCGLAHWQSFSMVHPTRSAIQMFKCNTIQLQYIK